MIRNFLLSMVLIATFATPLAVSAAGTAATGDACQTDADCAVASSTCKDSKCAAPPDSQPCDKDHPERGQCIKLVNPLVSDTTDLNVIFGTIIRVALSIVGSLTLLMLIWGGFQWLTSGGSPERVKKGTDTMLWAAIGVFLVFSSYIILITFTNFLVGKR